MSRINVLRGVRLAACISLFLLLGSCTVKYSFTGASIPAEVKTVTIENFPNLAQIVNPSLSTTLTESLKERFMQQTRLAVQDVGGDFLFSGEITDYTVLPAAVQGDETAALNRFTISVKVKFENRMDEKANFQRSFSAYEDFPSTESFSSVESGLVPTILEKLIDQIFNAAVANW